MYTVLYDRDIIHNSIMVLASRINSDYKNKYEGLVILSILNAAFMFTADISRFIDNALIKDIDFVGISSYSDKTQGKLKITKKPNVNNIKNNDILILDTIFDSGKTMKCVHTMVSNLYPKSIKTCCLINKNKTIKTDYQAFEYTGEKFIVGYGTDYGGLGRGLKDIYVV